MSKARNRNKAYKRSLRNNVSNGIVNDEYGNNKNISFQGTGRGMYEQLAAGYKVGPYARGTGKRAKKGT